MGKVARLSNKVESFAILGSQNCPCQHLASGQCTPAWHNSTAVQAAWPYRDILGSIPKEDALPPPPFSYLGLLFIYGSESGRVLESLIQVLYFRGSTTVQWSILFKLYFKMQYSWHFIYYAIQYTLLETKLNVAGKPRYYTNKFMIYYTN